MISEISPAARLTLFLSVAAQTTFWLVTALTAFFTKALILIASPGVRMYYLGHRQVTSLGALSEAATWLVFAAVPGAIGLLVGRLTPGRTMGVLVGLGANSICGSLLYWISTWVSPDQHFADSLAPFFFLSTFWIPVACTTAALTGWRGRRSQIRRRA